MQSINISQAREMEFYDDLVIYHTGGTQSSLNQLPQFSSWRNNFQELTQKYKKIPRGKLIDFLSFDFIIEHKEELLDQDPPQLVWTYMYGKSAEFKAVSLKINWRGDDTKERFVGVIGSELQLGIVVDHQDIGLY